MLKRELETDRWEQLYSRLGTYGKSFTPKQAFEKGYGFGYDDGYDAGYERGLKEAAADFEKMIKRIYKEKEKTDGET